MMKANSGKSKDIKEVNVANEKVGTAGASINQYRDSVRKLIDSEVKKALDEEVQKAAVELMEEQKKAIRLILEEHKMAIRQVVEEEKKEIWDKSEALRQSILKMGL
jgi:dsDNA-binding SOS-regulon protein